MITRLFRWLVFSLIILLTMPLLLVYLVYYMTVVLVMEPRHM